MAQTFNEWAIKFYQNAVNGVLQGLTSITGVNGTAIATGANPVPVRPFGAPIWANAQVDVLVTQTTLLSARENRSSAMIVQLGTVPVYLGTGSPTVSATNGILLAGVVGATVVINTTAAILGIAGSTQRVAIVETYG